MRTSIALQLQTEPETRDAFLRREALNRPINCEGAEKGRVVGTITHASTFTISFDKDQQVHLGISNADLARINATLADLKERRGGS